MVVAGAPLLEATGGVSRGSDKITYGSNIYWDPEPSTLTAKSSSTQGASAFWKESLEPTAAKKWARAAAVSDQCSHLVPDAAVPARDACGKARCLGAGPSCVWRSAPPEFRDVTHGAALVSGDI